MLLLEYFICHGIFICWSIENIGQMRPSNKVRDILAKIHSKKLPPSFRYAKIELDEECPQGTIPILRLKYNDIPGNISNLNKPQFSSLQSNGGLEVSDIWLSLFGIGSSFF